MLLFLRGKSACASWLDASEHSATKAKTGQSNNFAGTRVAKNDSANVCHSDQAPLEQVCVLL